MGLQQYLVTCLQQVPFQVNGFNKLLLSLNVIKDGMLFYLAIFTGINSAKVFGATPGLGGVIGGTTLLTGITDENPLKIFSLENI